MLPASLPQQPLLGRITFAEKQELLLANETLKTIGLIKRTDDAPPNQDSEAIAGLEWHLQCAAVASTPTG